MAERSNLGAVQRSRAASIVAAIAALLLVYAIAGPALAQSPSPSPGESPTAAASPGGAQPTATQPDTAIGNPGTTAGGESPIAFLLLGIGAVAAVLVYMGMRGSELRKAPVGSEREPRS